MKLVLIFLFVAFTTQAFSYEFKIRAREHFEVHEVTVDDETDKYRGLTNTINLWWEKPYETYIGLSFMPIIAGIREVEKDSILGERITQQNIGIEYKRFPKFVFDQAFFRLGAGYSRLEVDQGDRKNYFGSFTYLGLGYEVPFDSHGLALEMAMRNAQYQKGISIKTFTPSIGFHFYRDL